jgi:hypothetical protein
MSAPPLPQAFGNYALGDFVELVAPTAISWWPQTSGWWWLGAVLGILAARLGWNALRRWYRNRYRREAAARLMRLAGSAEGSVAVADINRLLKLAALAAFSRELVARLSGQEWVDFLNRQCPTPPFAPEQGRLLALAAYTGARTDAPGGRQLLAASLTWLRAHRNPLDD